MISFFFVLFESFSSDTSGKTSCWITCIYSTVCWETVDCILTSSLTISNGIPVFSDETCSLMTVSTLLLHCVSTKFFFWTTSFFFFPRLFAYLLDFFVIFMSLKPSAMFPLVFQYLEASWPFFWNIINADCLTAQYEKYW